MIQLPEESVLKWKKIFEEDYKREFSYEEAREAANNLIGFFDLLLKIDARNKITEKEVEKNDEQ